MAGVPPITVNVEASSAKTASGDGTAVGSVIGTNGVIFILDVTAAGSLVTDLLDVQIMTDLDGTNYVPICTFTQVLGNGGAKRFVAKIVNDAAVALFEYAAALAAGSTRALLGPNIRPSWVIFDGGGTHSFTFSISVVAF